MAKRIFNSMLLTAILAVILTAVLIVPALYDVYEQRAIDELRLEADYIVHTMNVSAAPDLSAMAAIRPSTRLTLVSPEGMVLFDSEADHSSMENHAQRPEIIQALNHGSGVSTRRSNTLSAMTIYYAQKTASGDVLRIASTRNSVLDVFANVLPLLVGMLLAVAVLSLLLARRSARAIVAPINALNLDRPLDNDAYDELAPLLSRMERQHTQLYQQMQALEQARTELAAVMDNMREGMILLDTQRRILSMNESALLFFGRDTAPLGQDLLTVIRDDALRSLVDNACRGEGGDMLLQRRGRTFQILVSPVNRDQTIHGTVLLIMDVTERFAAENSRREFTANVSHELKTPLTSISGFAEIIRDGIARPEDVPAFAGKIHDESRRLVALVNDIMELSRLDEKQGLGAMEQVSLLTLLQSLSEDALPRAQRKHLSLSLQGGDAQVQGYPSLLREMFFNLIDNAVKYTPEGGAVTLNMTRENGCVLCTVADNGAGIPPEHQAHVFERFYRVDKSHSRQTGGTGLGLAIVKHVAEIHHADISLTSEEGRGTAITIRFPSRPS